MRTVRTVTEASPATQGCEDVRCGCGSLLARFVDGAVELKCRRCKRVWRLPVEGEAPGAAGAAG
jgi:phage FluMu protein Com